MGEACRALDFPIVSGNVCLYNESKATGGGSAILPTPAIGGVGLLDDWEKSATIGFKARAMRYSWFPARAPNAMVSIWANLCGSAKSRSMCGTGTLCDLEIERRNGEFVRDLIRRGLVTAVHDISDGGLLVALAEMALAGNIGAVIQTHRNATRDAFSEDQGRYVVTVPSGDKRVTQLANDEGVRCDWIGETGGDRLIWRGEQDQIEADISIADLRGAHEGFFPDLMGSELPPEF